MAGLLGDIYSYGDTLKRKVNGLLADPRGTLEQFVGQLGDQANQTSDLMNQAGWMPIAKTNATKEQQAMARALLAEQGTNAATAGMFVGKGSKTWNGANAQKAEQLTAQGVDPRKVWSETGTWKGPDGMWRQETPDNAAMSRDYQQTPAKAFQSARFNAASEDSQILRDRAESMKPYYQKTKNQLTDEFSSTGNAIIEAATGGNMEIAKKLQRDRNGLTNILDEMGNVKYGPASSYIKHGDLGAAYPDVYGLHTRIDPSELSQGSAAHYFQGSPQQGEQIVLNGKPYGAGGRSTLLHEMQHAIQQREGFARGGSPEGLPESLAGDAQSLRQKAREMFSSGDRVSGLAMEKQARQLDGVMTMATNKPLWAYQNLAGEAEARATQARIPLTAEQRLATFPEDSYDVPMNQLIIRGGLLK